MQLPWNLPLADLVNAGDVVDAFNAVKLALMDAVDAYKPSLAVGGAVLCVRQSDCTPDGSW